jgi:histidyl-tRNA synthetase
MIKSPRGTQDILHPDSDLWQKIEDCAIKLFSQAGFKEIRTPIFEATELFDRAVGEDSDIVNKEMYSFNDRSDRSLTLRPEGTASIARAYIEHALDREGKPQKLWYRGPMFRYERPQTGRYRQFHQIGIEAIGAKAPYIDIELIQLGKQFLHELGLNDITLYINSLGNQESRTNYINALKSFLEELQDSVCEDCQRRFRQNPLRCLDCKVPGDQALYKDAPIISTYLDEDSKSIWQETLAALNKLGIKYLIDNNLVRGLDYYSHCVFEFKTDSKELGAQSTVLAGGRYDNLVKTLNGPDSPAVGWALGIERLALLIPEKQITTKKVFIISDDPLGAIELAKKLREDSGLCIELDYENSKFKKQLEKALKKNFEWAIFYLENERQTGSFKLKNLKENLEYSGLNYQELLRKL